MNTILFLCGAGAGALIATILLLFAVGMLRPNAKKEAQEAREQEAKSDAFRASAGREAARHSLLLSERNAIGERQVKALETLAKWAEANWKN